MGPTLRASVAAFSIASAFALSAIACGGKIEPAAPPLRMPLEVYDFTLPNGLRVILDEDHSAPVVSIVTWYKVGSKDDPPRRAGFAHLFEHLMFGPMKNAPDGVGLPMVRFGATGVRATTSFDRTVYEATLPSGALEVAIWAEAERMSGLTDRLEQLEFERERNIVLNEYRQNYENVEGKLTWNFIRAAVYGREHPYGHGTIGIPDELRRATLKEVREFHARYYRPANAILVLVGDFES